MHMRSHTSEYMYVTHVQLFMCSIHAACKQLHTNYIHLFICLYGMHVVLSQFLCMQHACNMDVLCVQHTCVTCAAVHVCSMYAAYMPNVVADIFDRAWEKGPIQ